MSKPDISVIIPTSRKTEELESCLGALSRQTLLNFEVIVVAKDIEKLMHFKESFRGLNLVFVPEKEKKGLASARNLGLSHAKSRVISFIDDDVIVSEDWSKQVLATFDKSADIGGVSGPTIIPQESLGNRDILAFHSKIQKNIFWKIIGNIYTYFVLENQSSAIGRIFKSGAFSLGPNYMESTKITSDIEVDYLEACNMSFRKDILDKIGGFSLEYKGVGDWSEPDLAFRVKKEGYRLVFDPRAVVYHHISQQRVYGDKGGDSYQRTKNFIYFYFKWIRPNTLDKAVRLSANLMFINLYWCYKFFQSKNKDWLYGIWGTVNGLFLHKRQA